MFKFVQGVGINCNEDSTLVKLGAMVTELSRSIDDNTAIISNRFSYSMFYLCL
jgi:hypothetical protein